MKNKLYFLSYYLMSILYGVIFTSIYLTNKDLFSFNYLILILSIMNIIFILIATVLFILKKKVSNTKVNYLNIGFIVFLVLMFINILLMNSNMIVPFIQSNYYLQLMLIPLTTINLYNLLNIKIQ